MMPPTMLTAALAAGAVYFSSRESHAFGPPTHIITSLTHHHHATPTATSSALFGKRRKPSMKERRKQRAKKQPSTEVDRGVLNDLPAVDTWEKTEPTAGAKRLSAAAEEQAEDSGEVDEAEKTAAKASSLVESQRKSVDCLTFIRKRVEETSFPAREAARAVADQGYFVYDGFLSSGDNDDAAYGDALLSEMIQEGAGMLSNDKLERDIARLGDGEYVTMIAGGEEYANCPRLTEYVVSLTRHLPPLLNKELDALGAADIARLDATASMGTLTLYDRKARLGAEALVATPEDDDGQGRPFGVVCGDSEGAEDDARRLTALFFLSSKEWDAACGGGITLEEGDKIEAVRDRIVLLRSDTCSHRQDPWKGSDAPALEQAACVVVHFVKEAAT